MARWNLVDALVERAHLVAAISDRVEEALLIPARRDSGGEERFDFGGEVEHVVMPGVEERLDPETVANPKALAGRAKLTIPDLERAFGVTERIVVQLSTLYEGIFSDLKFIGGDDYEVVLDWIRSAKCTFIENYEKEFHLPFDGPRPKDCSRKHNLLKMQ